MISFGKKFGKSEMLADEILRSKPDSIVVTVSKGGVENRWKNQLNISSIVIFDSPENFKENVKNIKWLSKKRMRHKHLVYAPNLSVSDVVENINNGFDIDNVGFLMNETEKAVDLVTSFMFTPNLCRSNQLVTINRFLRSTMSWENSIFFPKKYQNFNGCDLKEAKFYNTSLALELIPELSIFYNFNISHDRMKWQIDAINLSRYDLIEKMLPYDGDRKYITSTIFSIHRITFAVPPGDLYNSFEKMFLMFDRWVWILIVATLSIGFITIQVINYLPKEVQNFVFGRNIRTATLNLFNIFLTGAQFKIPGRNFSRFFLMLFIVWSMIIRTCYQSKLFKLLQADVRKPPIKTLDDLFNNNFTLYDAAIGVELSKK